MDKKRRLIHLKEFKNQVNKDIPITKMFLFGSQTSGKAHRWSDIDLVIVSSKFNKLNFFQRGAKMYDYWTLRQPVDFLCYTPKEFNKLKSQVTIVREAVRTGIEIK